MRAVRGCVVGAAWLVLGVGPSASAQDRDADGVLDAADLCPDVAERDAHLSPGDGCPDADTDGDRIADDYDVCPGAAETSNGFEDADGCADTEGAAVRELAERIHFETGEHTLDDDARALVARLAALIAAHPSITRVHVVGHADARGDDDANLRLSQARAEAVRDALVGAGASTAQVLAEGRGALPGDSPEVQAENRRCDVRVTLDADPRTASDLGAMAARWEGDALVDVEIAAHGDSSQVRVRSPSPAWLGPSDARFDCYAGRLVGERALIVCRSLDRELTLALRRDGTDRAVGFLEVRSSAGIDRAPWTGHVVPSFGPMDVVRMIQTRRSAIQACYERELRTEPTLTGRVAVQMTIEPSGGVVGVRVTSDTMAPPHPELGACLVRVIQGFRFSAGPLGGSVSYTFPFVFEPEPPPRDAGPAQQP